VPNVQRQRVRHANGLFPLQRPQTGNRRRRRRVCQCFWRGPFSFSLSFFLRNKIKTIKTSKYRRQKRVCQCFWRGPFSFLFFSSFSVFFFFEIRLNDQNRQILPPETRLPVSLAKIFFPFFLFFLFFFKKR
jgi:hypothetical protein